MAQQRTLAEELERFVRDQASLYGEVISYVPGKPERSAPPVPMGAVTDVAVGSAPVAYLESLNAKLTIHQSEAWMSATTLDELAASIQGCQKCALGATRNKLVFGVGNPQAKGMLIGEAPGADEDLKGEPFVGKAGQLLNKMIEAINLKREDVYIANILKSRPPNNRDPKPEEVEACEPYLWKQISIIKPKVILCLGRIAGTNLLKRQETLGKMRGQTFDFHGVQVIVTYHPAALLRNPDWKHGAWEDLKRFKEIYDSV